MQWLRNALVEMAKNSKLLVASLLGMTKKQ
jgi:hypothetical protein